MALIFQQQKQNWHIICQIILGLKPRCPVTVFTIVLFSINPYGYNCYFIINIFSSSSTVIFVVVVDDDNDYAFGYVVVLH